MATPIASSPLVIPKLIIALLLLGILASLFTSAFYLIRDSSNRRRSLSLLKIRVVLSVILVIFILIAYSMNWIQPHGLQL